MWSTHRIFTFYFLLFNQGLQWSIYCQMPLNSQRPLIHSLLVIYPQKVKGQIWAGLNFWRSVWTFQFEPTFKQEALVTGLNCNKNNVSIWIPCCHDHWSAHTNIIGKLWLSWWLCHDIMNERPVCKRCIKLNSIYFPVLPPNKKCL